MESDSVGLEFQHVELDAAHDVLIYSFIVQKSVAHLDLSSCEYSLRMRSIFTEEGFRKTFIPREILYRLHLDLPRNTERRIRVVIPDADNQYETMSVSECVYNCGFAPLIENSIRNAEDKVEKLRRYFNIMKLLKLHEDVRTAVSLFDSIIQILYPDCTDSELIAEFALTFHFPFWIFDHENPKLVGYVLHHVRRMRHNVWRTHQRRIDLVNACMISGTTGNVRKLLEYGTVLPFEFPLYLLLPLPQDNILPHGVTSIPRRRFFLLLQYFWVFMTSTDNSWEALCFIWRSIPDPYLNYDEINFIFGLFTSINLQAIVDRYKNAVVEESESDYVVPRALKHLCRVTVRSILNRSYQLPDGIGQLEMPSSLVTYLKLES
ncbi:hypothetical protein AVEN_195437-1 [Araneus ventricosus]|uniref:SOCS box domain-containing protein n=1 Tax=Araneus ventricosus TaxID=182803 RepID=A0A4Y2I1U7_ARAVE|nr:hypothetical protein AVEN_195437-1 [Araneus ventricosus]